MRRAVIISAAMLGLSGMVWLFYQNWKIAIGVSAVIVANTINSRLAFQSLLRSHEIKKEIQKEQSGKT